VGEGEGGEEVAIPKPTASRHRRIGLQTKRRKVIMPKSRTMNNSQKALQLWPLLVLAARTKTIHTYGMVAQMTGLANQHPEPLGHIAYYCMQRNLTLLSSLEVDKNGKPAAKFYKYIEVVKAEQSRCFTYTWLEHGVPTNSLCRSRSKSFSRPTICEYSGFRILKHLLSSRSLT